jgi:hypothetical protein
LFSEKKLSFEYVSYLFKNNPFPVLSPTGVGEDAGKKEPSYTVGGNVN